VRGWTVQDSANLYGIPQWGAGFFEVNESGHVVVCPDGRSPIDLHALVEELVHGGHRAPLLLRFSDVLDQRIDEIVRAFHTAIEEYGYRGSYNAVYPIKVNQQRHVVESVVELGVRNQVGLEAGSKPELLIALAHADPAGGPIVCNGYKDRAYIETALLAERLGRRPVLVIDRFSELELVIRSSRELGIRPHLGVRGRLTARGAGRWTESTGNRSKFGLSATELVHAVERLREVDLLDCLELVHIHIGSQITAIQAHKEALREVSRIYIGLRDLGADRLTRIDVGGGLGVDYDGSRTNFHSSMNYSMQEYANDVVSAVMDACDDAGHPHPDLLSESGRALVAHHALLVFDVLGVNTMRGKRSQPVAETDPRVMHELAEAAQSVTRKNVHEAYHDALQLREEALTLFALGYLDLQQRARIEQLFLECLERVDRVVSALDAVPEDLAGLERALADTYYGNFSVFQSAPDHWAVKQLFPVLPIHRLEERPTRRGVIADLTCDSDGKIDQFIDPHDVKDVLELHPLDGRPYYLGVFLVGAYQEILGDLHNLFGDTNAVHVRADGEGGHEIENVVQGDEISEVLHYVQYREKELLERVRALIDDAEQRGRLPSGDAERLWSHFTQAMREYTYLGGV